MRTALLDLYNFGQFALAEAVARLPSAALRRAAIDALAHAAYRLSREKRRLIERNVAYAFAGGIEPSETRRIAIGCFREFWQEMVDWVPAVGDRLPAAEIEIRGLVHLQQALARGKGAILWESNGFSRRVQAKRTLHAHGIPLHQTHGETHLGVMLSPPGEGTWLRERLMRPTYERRESAFVAETLIIPLHSGMAARPRLCQAAAAERDPVHGGRRAHRPQALSRHVSRPDRRLRAGRGQAGAARRCATLADVLGAFRRRASGPRHRSADRSGPCGRRGSRGSRLPATVRRRPRCACHAVARGVPKLALGCRRSAQ